MKRIYGFILLVMGGLSFSSCELDTQENFHFVNLSITEAEIPDFFVLGQSHSMDVTFLRPDSCTYFQGFDVFTDETGLTTVVAIGSVLTQEGDCTSTEDLLTEIVSVTIKDVEFYTLRFYTGDDANGNHLYDEHRVPVVDGINQ
ncbi:MAG: hypothetical protein ACFB0A_12085 [Croceivirga sp.]